MILYIRHQFPREIIQYAVLAYHQFNLSRRYNPTGRAEVRLDYWQVLASDV